MGIDCVVYVYGVMCCELLLYLLAVVCMLRVVLRVSLVTVVLCGSGVGSVARVSGTEGVRF